MGESSAPRRPTHDTNTSRREVKISEYTHTTTTTTTTTPHQSKHKHTMKFTGLIASTLMLLVFVMASTASALSIEKLPTCLLTTQFGDAIRIDGELMHGDIRDNKCCWYGELVHESQCYQNTPKPCCRAFTLECEACNAGVSEEEFCRRNPYSPVCPQKPDNKPTHPDNCYSRISNTEIMHGEMGARKCCWYGKWEKKSKCEKNPPVTHPDNCYSKISKKEIMHGEMGPKKCCRYGKWEKKSKCEKKPSHPHNCYSRMWKKEIMHGEVGPTKCCWYGDWKKKSKCEKKPSHRDNCYSNILKKEVMHGEMGAKKCCWYGDWKRKSKCNGDHKDD